MTNKSSTKGKPSSAHIQMSLEKFKIDLELLMAVMLDTTAESDRLAFYVVTLAPWSQFPSENKQNIRVAQLTKTTPQTVWNWRAGVTQCSALGRLYGFARTRFDSELDMAAAFGAAIGRDFLAETCLSPEVLK